MISEMMVAIEREPQTDFDLWRRLWRGVIARTIYDWLSSRLRAKLEAERYLFENSADLSSVCEAAGINIGRLRTCLEKVRGQTLLELVPDAR
jgi:hypothetical protein